jgi:hypothetical protein
MTYDEVLRQFYAAGGRPPIEDGEQRMGQSEVTLPDGRSIVMVPGGQLIEYEPSVLGRGSEGGGRFYRTYDSTGVSEPQWQSAGEGDNWKRSAAGAAGILLGGPAFGMAGNYLAGLYGAAPGVAGGSAAAGGGAAAAAPAAAVSAPLTTEGVLASNYALSGATPLSTLLGAGGGAAAGMTLADLVVPGALAASGIANAVTANRAGQIQADAARDAGQAQLDASRYAADSTLEATRDSNQLIREMFDQNRQDAMPWMEAGRTALTDLTAGLAPGGQFASNIEDRADIRGLTDRIGGVMDERFAFEQDPGYQFRLSEGERALNRAALAGGRYDSGRTLKDLLRYGQNFASNEYGQAFDRFRVDRGDRMNMLTGERASRFNMGSGDRTDRFNRLSSLAGTGQTATQQIGAAGMNTASQIGNNTIGGANTAGQARMAGAQGYGNAATSAAAARASGYVGGINAVTGAVGSGINYAQNNRLLEMLTRNR